MIKFAVLLVLGAQLCLAQQYPRYFKFPVGKGDECEDHQIGKRFPVGAVWTSPNSGCKQSHCIKENGTLYIDRFQCPSVRKRVDYKKLKADNLFCRLAWVDRRKAFPDCCPRLVCKRYVKGKLVALPEDEYPLL
ncbi:uncharacterized protein LOC119110905 [Pollicipes pollicipes]|uniref:uncharacterized protein LOC119108844 n=1 Tax=Pollicipes pollicipes TaxID=41117 RepID=UPI00188499FD|nr:uncharacterized protein LOC119108844 [Pollicipes pollicipes]XP_037090675.1 uncharacterized protein LOC119110905 [Pollicipes pollicipes]